ncbi:VanZ family protein [Cellulomonas sp.]|uniref:VanZ family protein n=1 Tax=Cellulomonas sp. TaxID=40001 RepID=UPI0025B809C8|nr:VanZ family protein [Cellulomonas sp.]
MRTGPPRGRRTAAALVVYLMLVARVTLWPSPAPGETFNVVRAVVGWFSDRGWPVTYAGVEAVANVVMFLPFGVLVGLLVRRWWIVVLLALATSATIELAQLAFLPTRVPTVQDVVLNTLGAALGVLALRLRTGRTTGRLPAQEEPARREVPDVSR